MNGEKKILVAGELNVDLILDDLGGTPRPGKEIIANRMLLTLGSSSAIFASNLAVLGTSVIFCGRVGRDHFAEKILGDLAARGVSTDHIIRSQTADTGITVAFSEGEERAMVTYPGAMNELCADDITDEMLDDCTHLHVSSVFLQPALKPGLAGLFRRAREKGLTTSLDPQWDPAEAWALDLSGLLPFVSIFLPNLGELKNITGRNSLEDALDFLSPMTDIVAVKNGNAGAVLQQNKTRISQPAYRNTRVADAIGAGDSFNAGFIHRFVQQKPLDECLAFGALCGAINTTQPGGTTAFPDYDAVVRTAGKHFNVQL